MTRPAPSFPGVDWPVKDYRDHEPEGGGGDATLASIETGNALFGVTSKWMAETITAMFDAEDAAQQEVVRSSQ